MNPEQLSNEWDETGPPDKERIREVFEFAYDLEDPLQAVAVGYYLADVLKELDDPVVAAKLYEAGARVDNLIGFPLVVDAYRFLLPKNWQSNLASHLYRHSYWTVRILIQVAMHPGITWRELSARLMKTKMTSSLSEKDPEEDWVGGSLRKELTSHGHPSPREVIWGLEEAFRSHYLGVEDETEEDLPLEEEPDRILGIDWEEIKRRKVRMERIHERIREGEGMYLRPRPFPIPRLEQLYHGKIPRKGARLTPQWGPGGPDEFYSTRPVEDTLSELDETVKLLRRGMED